MQNKVPKRKMIAAKRYWGSDTTIRKVTCSVISGLKFGHLFARIIHVWPKN